MPNTQTLTAIGEIIATAARDLPELTAENIRVMHREPQGAEMLRLIVRDNLGNAGSIIACALLDTL